nr:immunoglobulin heavy chain junction region [Macaca mulatta]MOW91754.1 immunoglobulin heavy chain junction region [Macaca mulatta]
CARAQALRLLDDW